MMTIQQRERAIINPPPRLKISEWAEKEFYIPREGNAEPGKYHGRRMPWQAAMLNDAIDPTVQESFWEMCSQYSGKTLCFTIITLYRMKVLQESTIIKYPTLDSCKKWMRKKLEPAAEATPCMKGLLRDPRERDAKSTMLDRAFPGGSLTGIGANSTSAFRGTTASGVLQDEIDADEDGDEGDPCLLADRATETFSNPVKLKASTPILEGFSRIHAGYLSGDQQKYFVPCPCCGHMQDLKTEQMKFSFTEEEHARFTHPMASCEIDPSNFTWSIGDFKIQDLENAIYVCEKCQRGWTDSQRIAAIMSGHPDNPPIVCRPAAHPDTGGDNMFGPIERRAEWRATAPFTGIRSRHLNGMYATIGLKQGFKNFLHMFAKKFLTAKRGGTAKFQVWVNTFKTEPFEEESEKVDWKELFDRREEYGPSKEIAHVPDRVLIPIALLDNQADRVEITSLGFGPSEEIWVLDHNVIFGDFDDDPMRERVAKFLFDRRFTHRTLGEMAYGLVLMDSAFQKSPKVKAVYRFCAKHASKDCFAIRGAGNMGATVYSSRKEHAFRIRVFHFNSDMLKGILIGMLKNKVEAGKDVESPNTIHFPKRQPFNEVYFAGVCSETYVKKRLPSGGIKGEWRKKTTSTRNEPWDLLYYGLGGKEILRSNGKVEWIERTWEEVQKKLELLEPSKPSTMRVAAEVKEPEARALPPKGLPRSPFAKVQQPSWRRWVK